MKRKDWKEKMKMSIYFDKEYLRDTLEKIKYSRKLNSEKLAEFLWVSYATLNRMTQNWFARVSSVKKLESNWVLFSFTRK